MRKEKDYEVVFAKGTPQEVRYPERTTSKQKAAEAFCQDYLGRYDGTLIKLLKVYEVKDEEDDPVIVRGDTAECFWCNRDFTYLYPSLQQVGAGMYWCGCEEKES